MATISKRVRPSFLLWSKSSLRGTYPFVALAAAYVAASHCLSVVVSAAQLESLTVEDGLVEMAGAIFFLGASILFLVAYLKRRTVNSTMLYSLPYLGLSLLFFFGAGEEISWGQRVFGWETPSSMVELNQQQELNLHNIGIFHGRDR